MFKQTDNLALSMVSAEGTGLLIHLAPFAPLRLCGEIGFVEA
jgi:hypothetical protein